MLLRLGQRRKLLLDPLQLRLLVVELLHVGFLLLALAAAIFGPLILELLAGSSTLSQRELAADQFLALHSRLWLAVPIVVVMIILHAMIVSHRIVGPLYRMRQLQRKLQRGDLSVRARLRRNDYLGSYADSFNDMAASLEVRMASIRQQHAVVSQRLAQITEQLEAADRDSAMQLARSACADAEQLSDQLGEFIVSQLVESKPAQASRAKADDLQQSVKL